MEELLLKIGDRLKAQMPELSGVAEDLGELDPVTGSHDVPYPGVLVDLGSVEWTPCNEGLRGRAEVVVKLALDCAAGSSWAGDEKFAERLAFANKVPASLHGWMPAAGYSSMQLASGRFYTLPGQKKVYVTTYVVKVTEQLFAAQE